MKDFAREDRKGNKRQVVFELSYPCGCKLASYGSAQLYEVVNICKKHQEKLYDRNG